MKTKTKLPRARVLLEILFWLFCGTVNWAFMGKGDSFDFYASIFVSSYSYLFMCVRIAQAFLHLPTRTAP